MQSLRASGYCVISCDRLGSTYNQLVRDLLADAPELAQPLDLDRVPLVGGGTAFVGLPTLYYAEEAWAFRREFMHHVLETVFLDCERNIEWLLDRTQIRVPGKQPTRETRHVDTTPWAASTDQIFGGFLNCDDTPQYFHCWPGEFFQGGAGRGFERSGPATDAATTAPATAIEVPPNHCILFNQLLYHEVAPTKHSTGRASIKYFFGVRVTDDAVPLHGVETTRQWLRDQDCGLLKSGQPASTVIPNRTLMPTPANADRRKAIWRVYKPVPHAIKWMRPKRSTSKTATTRPYRFQEPELNVERACVLPSLRSWGTRMHPYCVDKLAWITPQPVHLLLQLVAKECM